MTGTRRCVVLDDYQGVALEYAAWSRLAGVETSAVREHLGGDDLVAALAGAEVVVAMRERTGFDAALLDRLPDLRLLVTTGRRNPSIDLDACRERGITVCATSARATPTVELTWALVLGLARRLVPESRALATGEWQTTVGTDLAGSTLGVVGLGRIGSRVAALGRAFDMDVVAWSPHLTAERAADAGVRAVDRDELLATADVVTLHLVLAASTRGTIGAAELAAMRPTAYLVNTARAGLVDTGALLAALDAGTIAGAGLDVHDEEPLPAGHPVRTHPRVLATPHLGYVTERNYRTFFSGAVEDVEAWLAGHPVRVLT
ncbi:D-2-hydroxyacid dehydrogenase family protein [Nocardioides sp. SOB77]|uniref:D-2-hydroxyacid dehydrogenase family protein n=1 Tax=Nocardioides oceani TaxID=3058369 RepID=A0ABT8FB51_9ACTN|nr:D-2-hydroxyacid dehydrogenase family protein [Nocardioides oceani]MDN4171660.1 D-2-hydroxyacid dehydrogenase family protein [Nocardioides oceani]